MAATVRFLIDKALIPALRKDPEFAIGLTETAQNIAGRAASNGSRYSKTYRADVTVGESGLPRVEAHALGHPRNESFGGTASWIEFGSKNMAPRAPLRRAVQSLGLTLGA